MNTDNLKAPDLSYDRGMMLWLKVLAAIIVAALAALWWAGWKIHRAADKEYERYRIARALANTWLIEWPSLRLRDRWFPNQPACELVELHGHRAWTLGCGDSRFFITAQHNVSGV